jgi:hypothetical protein
LPKHSVSVSGWQRKRRHSSRFQQPQKFCARHQQFAAKRTARPQFATLNEPINAEVVDAKKIGSLLNGIGKPLLFRNGRLGHWSECFHAVNAEHTRPLSASRSPVRAVLPPNYFGSSTRMLVITPFSPLSKRA